MKALIVNLIIVCACILISLPFRPYSVLKYELWGAHLVLALSVFLVPAIFFLGKQYWKSRITMAVWGLRVLAIVGFLITSFRLGISGLDLVTLGGTIGLTFFYEMGYFLSAAGYLHRFLQCLLWVGIIITACLYTILAPIVRGSGVDGLISHIGDVQVFVPSWPNHFGIYLVLLFWLVVFLAHKSNNRKYYLTLALIVPTLFLTLSRTALVALGVSMLFAAWRERRRFRPATVGLLFLAFLVAGSIGYSAFDVKDRAGFGSSLSQAIDVRQRIWESGFTQWKEHPVLGYGLRSFTEVAWGIEIGGGMRQVVTAHNDYLDLLVRGGLLYSIPFWLFVLFVVHRGLKLGDYQGYLFRCLSYSIIALLAAAFAQNVFKCPDMLAFFWSYVAAFAFYGRKEMVDNKEEVLEKPGNDAMKQR